MPAKARRKSRQESHNVDAIDVPGPRTGLVLIGLLAATIAAYFPIFSAGFVEFDDPEYFSRNQHILAGLSAAGVRWAFTNPVGVHWHPLTVLSHMLDATLFGAGATGPHLVNLAIHLVNTILLFKVLREFTGRHMPSVIVAALFALHPLHVESVAWISARKDVLSMLFTLLALLAYGRYARAPRPARMGIVALLFACALMSKPVVVTLPFLLLVVDVWPLERVRHIGWWRAVIEKLPLWGLAVASSVITLLVQREAGIVVSAELLPVPYRLTHALVSYGHYLRQTVWPSGLAFYYPYARGLDLPVAAACGLVLAAITWLAWLVRRSRPYVLVGWLWFLGTMVPVIGLIQSAGQARADRYTYLPLEGLFLAAVWTASRPVSANARRAAATGVAVILLGCAVRTYQQVGTWHDTYTLATQALRVDPDNGFAHSLLGVVLMNRGESDSAVREFNAALRSAETHEDHANLGILLARKGDHAEALRHFERSVALDGEVAETRYNLGHELMLLQQYDAALPHLRKAVSLHGEYAEAHFDLGSALWARDDVDGAIAEFKTTARLANNHPAVHPMLGSLLIGRGDIAGGVEQYRLALGINPNDAEVMHKLAWLEATHPSASIRNGADAVRLEQQAIRLTDGRNPAVFLGLAAAYAELGQFSDACSAAERAIDLAARAGASDIAEQGRFMLQLFKSNRPLRLSS